MTRQSFDALVRRIEERYAGRQSALERATTLWMALGLVGFLSWILLVTGLGLLFFGLGTIAEAPASVVLILVGGPIALYGALQALFILRIDLAPSEGRLVKPGEAPVFDAMLEALRRDLQCRPFDEVRITLVLNASVRDLPRLGFFGWSHMILEIGLPLAQAMSPDELKAILAHECVHLSARHGRSSARIYRVNRTWGNLFQQMQQPGRDSFGRFSRSTICKFANWYWPRLHARGLVLSRMHEFHADRDAARIAGGPALAMGLWRLEVLSTWISERFWPETFARAAEQPEPPEDIAVRLTNAIQTPPAPEDVAQWTERGLTRATLHDETHPSLLDRVRPLGFVREDFLRLGFPTVERPTAAEFLLGDLVPIIEGELSHLWRTEVIAPWRDRHRRATSIARRQPEIPETTTLDVPSTTDIHALWETACEVVNLQGVAAAEPLLTRVLNHDPDHDGASVVLGRHRALAGDPRGEEMLHRVLLRNEENWTPRACESLQEVYRLSGQLDRFREIQSRLDRHESDLRASQRERSTITTSDRFESHGLTDAQLAPLRELLISFLALRAAWLTRKKLSFFPNRPLFVLCIRGTASRWTWNQARDQEDDLVRRLVPKVELPGQVLVISRQGSFHALARRIMKRSGDEVFHRDGPPE
jgi:Zn-dependent protease with chaperone function